MKFFGLTCACVAMGFSLAGAVLDLPNAQPKVDAAYWNAALDSTWQGLIRRNIQPYSTGAGLIHRPKSETPGDAVSEGVGYGMIVALYSNDQDHFNKMWEAANEKMWNGSFHDWHMLADGNIPNGPDEYGTGAATDAEEDIAYMMVDGAEYKFDLKGINHEPLTLDMIYEVQCENQIELSKINVASSFALIEVDDAPSEEIELVEQNTNYVEE